MKIRFGVLLVSLILAGGLWFSALTIYRAYLNYGGYCLQNGRKISDNEKIRSAVDFLLNSRYPKNEERLKALLRSSDGKSGSDLDSAGTPIAYRDALDFIAVNRDCCQVLLQPRGIDFPPATFLDRITGQKSSFVEIQYFLRYVDNSGIAREEKRNLTVAIKNCGHVWNGF